MCKKLIGLLLAVVFSVGIILLMPKSVKADGATVTTADALKEALSGSETTDLEVVLGADITLQYATEFVGEISIQEGRNVVIDLNNRVLTFNEYSLISSTNARLTIKNGTIVSELNGYPLFMQGTESNKAELILENVDFISNAVVTVIQPDPNNDESEATLEKSGSMLYLNNVDVTVDNSYLWTNCDLLLADGSANNTFVDGNGDEITVGDNTTVIKTKESSSSSASSSSSSSSSTSSSGSTTVTAVVGASYVMEIPETIDFGNITKVTGADSKITREATLTATTLIIGDGKILNVRIQGDGTNGAFVIENTSGEEIPLEIKDADGNPVSPNALLASFDAVGASGFSVSLDRSNIADVGSYSGSIYFTFSVDDAN